MVKWVDKIILTFFGMITSFPICAGQEVKTTNCILDIRHDVDGQLLQLNNSTYFNQLSQPYKISRFKYYLGQITLLSSDGTQDYELDQYFIVDEEDANSKQISLQNVPTGEYVGMRFTLGVDSAMNCSGAQSGALDPLNGMFWSWSTGYIFLKFEGHSELSSAPDKSLEYHIGGYQEPVNCIQDIRLMFKQKMQINDIEEKKIVLNVNVAEIFKTPKAIDFTQLPTVTGRTNALLIATNYADMFSLTPIIDE